MGTELNETLVQQIAQDADQIQAQAMQSHGCALCTAGTKKRLKRWSEHEDELSCRLSLIQLSAMACMARVSRAQTHQD